MRPFVPFLVLFVLAAVSASAQAAEPSLQEQVAAALMTEIRARLGASASVSIGTVQVALRGRVSGSLAVVPSPQAVLNQPVEFVVIGAGANGRPVQVGRGHAHVFVTVPHAQAARTLTRGSTLNADDIVECTSDPGAVPLRRLPTARELVGATTRRDVAGGEVLTLQTATLPPAVKVGDTVQAVALVGSVRVSAELTAMDTGAEGAIVRVVNRETRRELRARVVRSGVVEVIHE
jgi:flagella basal body P-ring formation protein FlgA